MLPEAFLERMQRLLGEEYEDFLESFDRESCQALRLNVQKRGADGCNGTWRYRGRTPGRCASEESEKKTDFARLTKVPWAENGYYYQAGDQPGKHPCHEAGLYYIQEPSAMAPAELLDIQPGERVLDLCAAPGGKTTQIGAKLRGSGFLVSNEIHPARAKILSENVERMGIGNALVLNETPERLAGLFPEYFDAILVDAPCSGEGMFRKNGAACEEWSPENVALCAERQRGILDCAAAMLRPGGRLVYSTCTFAPEENEGSVSAFLKNHDEFEILPIKKEALGLSGCDGRPDWIEAPVPGLENTLRLWPQRIRGEGHFAALLGKAGQNPKRYNKNDNSVTNYAKKKKTDAEAEEFLCFFRENLCFSPQPDKREGEESGWNGLPGGGSGILPDIAKAAGLDGEVCTIRFGDNIYLAPADFPPLKGLKVLRPGLHLGEFRKGRFEPSHALALALAPGNAAHIWNLDSGSPLVSAYLNGQTFPAQGEKGWYLICVDGFGLGWGKLAGNVMKNHYPKGLRR